MVELRKRPPPKETATPAPAAKRGSSSMLKKLADKAKEVVAPKSSKENGGGASAVPDVSVTEANGSAAGSDKIEVGKPIELDGFGGTVQTNDGKDVTVKELLEKSVDGVVIFTYPKASTPGCTTQACLFRDSYAFITGASLSVFGLSTDSPKANTTFVTKQNLPYPLLCDPNATLTTAIGMKKPGPGKSTARGVVIIDKQGVIRVCEQAGPAKTLDTVLEYIKTQGTTQTDVPAAGGAAAPEEPSKLADPDTKMDEYPLVKTPSKDEQDAATTAAEVGVTAAKIDQAVGALDP